MCCVQYVGSQCQITGRVLYRPVDLHYVDIDISAGIGFLSQVGVSCLVELVVWYYDMERSQLLYRGNATHIDLLLRQHWNRLRQY